MKYKITLLLSLLSFIAFSKSYKNGPDTLQVSYYSTVILIYDETVKKAFPGSEDLLAEKDGKIIKLTAAIPKIHETNLFVETESGYYSYIILYSDKPNQLTHFIKSSTVTIEKITPANTGAQAIEKEKEKQAEAQAALETEAQQKYLKDCEKIVTTPNGINDVGVIGTKVTFMLGDIYINNDMLYFKVIIKNTSNIPYDIELFRLAIRSKKGAIKQQAVQETVLDPVYIYNDDISQIKGKDGVVKIFVMKKFTITDDKRLYLELWENGGERILSFPVSSDQILSVKTIY